MLPQKSDLLDIVKTGKVPDGPCIKYGNLKIDPDKVPAGFRKVANEFRSKGDEDIADAYEGLADTVEAVASGSEIPVRELPKQRFRFIEHLAKVFPANPNSVCTSMLHSQYVGCAAAIMYGQYRE
jgi:hypothetical protein